MARRPFPRHESGLVDFECYLPYLPDRPDAVPIYVVPSLESPFVHQHAYFKWCGYRSSGKTQEEALTNPLSKFRSFSYNQILMRRAKEKKVHRDFELDVEPPPPSTVADALWDFRQLDIAAAATTGLGLVLHPERHSQYFPNTNPSALAGHISRIDMADFLSTTRETAINELLTPRVVPHRVVTSAFKRLSVYLGDTRLAVEADVRLESDGQYYPLRMRHMEHFLSLSNYLLKQEFLESREQDTSAEAVAA